MEQVLQKNKIDWMILFSSIIPFILVFFYASGSPGDRTSMAFSPGDRTSMALSGIFFAFISFFILYFKDKLEKQTIFFTVLSIWSCPTVAFPSYLLTHNFLTIGTSVLFSGLLCTILFFTTALKKRIILLFLISNIILFSFFFLLPLIFNINLEKDVFSIWKSIGLTSLFYFSASLFYVIFYLFFSIFFAVMKFLVKIFTRNSNQ